MTVPFISVADLGKYTGQDLSSSDLAVMMADSACQMIRDEIDQLINYVEDDVVTLDGKDRNMLVPPELPIVDVTEITIDGGDPLVADDDYRVVNERTMIQRLSSGVPDDDVVWSRETAIQVTYSHGWVVSEDAVDVPAGKIRVPSSLRAVALSLAALGLVAGRTGVGGVSSETIGRYKYTIDSSSSSSSSGMILSDDQLNILHKYYVEAVA
jgi:hypothetical protein